MFSHTLIVMAHSDDEILGYGGLLAKHSKPRSFRVLFLAESSSYRYDMPKIELYKSAIAEREKSAKETLSIFVTENFHFMDLPHRRFDQFPILELNKIIEHHTSDFKPSTILTHSEYDTNSDHRKVAESILMATPPGALNIVSKVPGVEISSLGFR